MLFFISLTAVIGYWIWKTFGHKFNSKIFIRDARMAYKGARGMIHLAIARKRNLTVDKLFEISAKKNPNKVCFKFENEKWTFREVQAKVNQISNYFQREGFVKGDHIGLFMENRVEFVCLWLGLAKIGVVPALINYNLRLAPLQHCLKAGSCKGIIYGGNLYEAIDELQENGMLEKDFKTYIFTTTGEGAQKKVEAVDLAAELNKTSTEAPIVRVPAKHSDELFYIFTSGTTGLPKAAVIRHSRYLYGSTGFYYFTGTNPVEDIVYASLPLYHTNAGIFAIGQAIQFGVTVAIAKKFSASRFWHDCIKHDATIFQYIGEICRYLLAQPQRPEDKKHRVRLIFGNGLRPEIWREFVTRFNIKNVCEFYGSTEGNCNIMNIDGTVGAVGALPRITSAFLPFHLLKVDKEGNILRDPATGLALKCENDEPGELIGIINEKLAHSSFEGYTDPEAVRKKITTDILKKGDKAFRSGDILVRDKFGYLYFKDRQGDTFRWKGENVSTAEVENVVSKAVDLRDSTVYGVSIPGADGKAGMAAIVDPTNTLDLNSLAATLATELPSYARPLFIRILKQIEMTGTYKFKKTDLQKEGFDITKVKDPVYFLQNGKYVVLDSELHNAILEGNARV